MTIQKLAPVIVVASMAEATTQWTELLGTAPTFVDGDRWAQFDTEAGRIALASAEEADGAGLMIKVADLDAAHARLRDGGMAVGPIATGHHERRFTADAAGCRTVFYAPV